MERGNHPVNPSNGNVVPFEYHAVVPVECPKCHERHFLDLQLEKPIENSPTAIEIRRHLELWLASRCPDHLGPILKQSKN